MLLIGQNRAIHQSSDMNLEVEIQNFDPLRRMCIKVYIFQKIPGVLNINILFFCKHWHEAQKNLNLHLKTICFTPQKVRFWPLKTNSQTIFLSLGFGSDSALKQ